MAFGGHPAVWPRRPDGSPVGSETEARTVSTIVVANALFTMALLIQTDSLISALFEGASEAINALMHDVVLMATSNILIFSVWYWLIDPPGIEDDSRADEPWDFLPPAKQPSATL